MHSDGGVCDFVYRFLLLGCHRSTFFDVLNSFTLKVQFLSLNFLISTPVPDVEAIFFCESEIFTDQVFFFSAVSVVCCFPDGKVAQILVLE